MSNYGTEMAQLLNALCRVVAAEVPPVDATQRAAQYVARDTCLLTLRSLADVATGRQCQTHRWPALLLAADPAAALRSALHRAALAAPGASVSDASQAMGADMRTLTAAALRLDAHVNRLLRLPQAASTALLADVAQLAEAWTHLDEDLRRHVPHTAVDRNLVRAAAERTLRAYARRGEGVALDDTVLEFSDRPVTVRGPGDLAAGVRVLCEGLAKAGPNVSIRDVATVLNAGVKLSVLGARILREAEVASNDPAALGTVADLLDEVAQHFAQAAAARPGVETVSPPIPGLAIQADLLGDGLRGFLDQLQAHRTGTGTAVLARRHAAYEVLEATTHLDGLADTLQQAIRAAAQARYLLVPTRTVETADVPYRWCPAPSADHPHVAALMGPVTVAAETGHALALPLATAHDALGMRRGPSRLVPIERVARLDVHRARRRQHHRALLSQPGIPRGEHARPVNDVAHP